MKIFRIIDISEDITMSVAEDFLLDEGFDLKKRIERVPYTSHNGHKFIRYKQEADLDGGGGNMSHENLFVQFETRDFGEMLLRVSTIDAIVKTADGAIKVVSSIGNFFISRDEKNKLTELLLALISEKRLDDE